MQPGDIIATILRDFPYALYGSILVAVTCAFLGVYIVSRKVVFFGAVLTEVSVLGLTLTFLPFLAVPHTLGSLVVTLGSAVILSQLLTGRNIPKDAILGLVFVLAVAARILIMQKASRVESAEVENLLRGDILFVTPDLFWIMMGCFALALLAYLLFGKEFSLIAFDAETARAAGYHARMWDLAFYLLAAAIIAVATHMVGDLFVFGFLVVPPVTAMLLVRKVSRIFLTAVLLGVFAPPIGLFCAFLFDFPASPSILAVVCILALGAYVLTLVRKR